MRGRVFAAHGPPSAAVGDVAVRMAQARSAAGAPDRVEGPDPQSAAVPMGEENLSSGPGRDLVSGICGACRSVLLVTRQGLARRAWAEVPGLKEDEDDMPEFEAGDGVLVLDHLAKFYGPDRRAGRNAGAGGK